MLAAAFGDQSPAQAKVALGLVLLRVPLLPQEVDPSQDALVQAAGETASPPASWRGVDTHARRVDPSLPHP